jgi:hypothetical protein
MFKKATVFYELNPMGAARSRAYSGAIGTEVPQVLLSKYKKYQFCGYNVFKNGLRNESQ